MKKTERYIKYSITICLFFMAVCVKAQIWLPLNFQPDKIPLASYADGTNYYVCYDDGFAKNGKVIKIAKWNGLVWQRATPLVLDSNAIVNALTVFKGDLIIAGRFSTADNSDFTNILRLTDAKWDSFKGGAYFANQRDEVLTMVSFKNQLFIGGSFDTINKIKCTNISVFDGVEWKNVATAGANGVVKKLLVINEEVYAIGEFTEIGGVNSKGVSKLVKDNWESIGVSGFTNSEEISSLNGKAFIASKIGENFYFYTHNSGDSWTKNMNGLGYCTNVTSMQLYNGKIYAAGRFFFSKDDSANAALWDGTTWTQVPGSLYKPYKFDVFQKHLMVYGDIVLNQNATRPIYTARFEPDLVLIKGFAFWDKNANCKFTNGEQFLARERIKLIPSNKYLYTNDKGYFSALVDKNVTYTIEIEPRKHWKVSSCAKAKVEYKYDEDSDHNIVFPLFIEANKKDIAVSITGGSGWKASIGKRQFYKITYKNLGSVNQNGTISLNFDKRLKNFEAYPAPTFYNPGEVAWRFSDLDVNEQKEISFYVKIEDQDLIEDEELKFSVSGSISDDEFTEDNVDTLQQALGSIGSASIFKSMYPEPKVGDSMAYISAGTEFVKFLIHFENENEEPISTVHVIDTIDLNLSLAYIQELGASHDYITNVYNDPSNPEKGIIVWTFKNINLGKFDSEGGYENPTFGYISFEMKLKDNNALGTVFSNTARVIYDYSNEYVTNTVWGQIVDPSVGVKDIIVGSEQLEVFPNPVNDFANISLEKGFQSIQVMDVLGNVVLQYNFENNQYEHTLNMNNLSAGTYFLIVENAQNKYVNKIIKN